MSIQLDELKYIEDTVKNGWRVNWYAYNDDTLFPPEDFPPNLPKNILPQLPYWDGALEAARHLIKHFTNTPSEYDTWRVTYSNRPIGFEGDSNERKSKRTRC